MLKRAAPVGLDAAIAAGAAGRFPDHAGWPGGCQSAGSHERGTRDGQLCDRRSFQDAQDRWPHGPVLTCRAKCHAMGGEAGGSGGSGAKLDFVQNEEGSRDIAAVLQDGRFHANHLAVKSAMPPSAHPPGAKPNACSSEPCWPTDDAPSRPPCDTRGRAIPRRSVSTIRCSIVLAGPLSKAVAVCCPCWCRPSMPLAVASRSSLTKRWSDAGADASTSAVITATRWLPAASAPSAPVAFAGSC